MPKSRFSTCVKKYALKSEGFFFPSRFGPIELNKFIKKVLNDENIDTTNINFNFYINGEILRDSFSEFVESKGISEEIEEIVYDIDIEMPILENETKTEQFIMGMKFNSKWIATASCDLQIFDTTSPSNPVVFIPSDTYMNKVDWISLNEESQEAVIVAGGEWNKLVMYKCDLTNGSSNPIIDFKGHLKSVTNLSVNHNKTLLASGSQDGMLKIWSASETMTDLCDETGGIPHISKKKDKIPTRIPLVTINAHNLDICDIQWLAEPLSTEGSSFPLLAGGNLLTCSNDFYLKLWSIAGHESSVVREVKANTHLRVMDANLFNQLVLTGSNDSRLRCFDLRAQVAEVHNVYKAHNHSITGVKWSATNSNLFVTTCRQGITKLWDVRNMKSAYGTISQFPTSVSCCDWSDDGQLLANSYVDGSLKFYRFNK